MKVIETVVNRKLTKDGIVVGEIAVQKVPRYLNERSLFMFRDIFYYLGKKEAKVLNVEQDYFYNISVLYVDEWNRKKGLGSRLIQEAMVELRTKDGNLSNVIIAVKSNVLQREYPKEPTQEIYNSVLERNARFYKRNGFVDVNSFIGQYQLGTVMIYNNPAYKNFMSIYRTDQVKKGHTYEGK